MHAKLKDTKQQLLKAELIANNAQAVNVEAKQIRHRNGGNFRQSHA